MTRKRGKATCKTGAKRSSMTNLSPAVNIQTDQGPERDRNPSPSESSTLASKQISSNSDSASQCSEPAGEEDERTEISDYYKWKDVVTIVMGCSASCCTLKAGRKIRINVIEPTSIGIEYSNGSCRPGEDSPKPSPHTLSAQTAQQSRGKH